MYVLHTLFVMKYCEIDVKCSQMNGEILQNRMINHVLTFEDITLKKLGLLESSSGCSRFKNDMVLPQDIFK